MTLQRDIQRVLDHADNDIIQLGLDAKTPIDQDMASEGRASYNRAAGVMQASEDLRNALIGLIRAALLTGCDEDTHAVRVARIALERSSA